MGAIGSSCSLMSVISLSDGSCIEKSCALYVID
jgi:hypothetical protein